MNEVLVWVRWEDCRLLDGPVAAADIDAPIFGEDIGWLVEENEKYIAIALQKFDSSPGCATRYRSVSVIPRRQIVDHRMFSFPWGCGSAKLDLTMDGKSMGGAVLPPEATENLRAAIRKKEEAEKIGVLRERTTDDIYDPRPYANPSVSPRYTLSEDARTAERLKIERAKEEAANAEQEIRVVGTPDGIFAGPAHYQMSEKTLEAIRKRRDNSYGLQIAPVSPADCHIPTEDTMDLRFAGGPAKVRSNAKTFPREGWKPREEEDNF